MFQRSEGFSIHYCSQDVSDLVKAVINVVNAVAVHIKVKSLTRLMTRQAVPTEKSPPCGNRNAPWLHLVITLPSKLAPRGRIKVRGCVEIKKSKLCLKWGLPGQICLYFLFVKLFKHKFRPTRDGLGTSHMPIKYYQSPGGPVSVTSATRSLTRHLTEKSRGGSRRKGSAGL